MTEEVEPTGTLLEHRIAQARVDIESIDSAVAELQAKAESLRVEQVELRLVLKKLTAVDIAEVAEPEEPVPP